MQISISGQHITVKQSFQEYIKHKLNDVVPKYFGHAIGANVHFSKQSFHFECDICLNDASTKHLIRSDAVSDDSYHAFDTAIVKLEKQLRKYKSKLVAHHKPKPSEISLHGTKYVIRPNLHEEDLDDSVSGDNPVIIAEHVTEILSLSVGEAVMKMDLENLPALIFHNRKNNRMNVVYHRRDGNIAWVDYDPSHSQ